MPDAEEPRRKGGGIAPANVEGSLVGQGAGGQGRGVCGKEISGQGRWEGRGQLRAELGAHWGVQDLAAYFGA